MRRKISGYILQWTMSDHDGTHIHIYKGDDELGVYDLAKDEPIRGLRLTKQLIDAIGKFRDELDDRLQQEK